MLGGRRFLFVALLTNRPNAGQHGLPEIRHHLALPFNSMLLLLLNIINR
jgi:hypothetical protein